MPYSINVDLQHLEDGAEVHIEGVGTLKNREKNIVEDEVAELFELANLTSEPAIAYDYDSGGNKVEGSGREVGTSQVRHSFVELISSYQGLSAEPYLEDLELEPEEPLEVTDKPNSLPLYLFVGSGGIDTDIWPEAEGKEFEGNRLHTFFRDVPGGKPTGISDEWKFIPEDQVDE